MGEGVSHSADLDLLVFGIKAIEYFSNPYHLFAGEAPVEVPFDREIGVAGRTGSIATHSNPVILCRGPSGNCYW
jgi:hypothetical protein